MPSIFSVAQSGLNAAQLGMVTTGHNIANANNAGYSRQLVVQTAAAAQDTGSGFIGKGTFVVGVNRIADSYLNGRINDTQIQSSYLDNYFKQVSQINNLLSDTTAGLMPNMQEFFNGVQTLASDPNSSPARQTMLSSADQLTSAFHSLDNQLSLIRDGVNSQITTSIETINSYANQISRLNLAIETAMGAADLSRAPNDLLDQRDQLVTNMAKEIKVTVVPEGNSFNVFIGNGQPLVVGANVYTLAPTVSSTDQTRAEVAYTTPNATITLAESAIAGGKLGGLFDFRSKTLDEAQNALGRIATGIGMTFNAQHRLGQDQNGDMGGDFFNVAVPLVRPSTFNKGTGALAGAITDVSALTDSDYSLTYDGSNYTITRLSDSKLVYAGASPPATAVDGVTYDLTGAPAAGDFFLIRPTALGAASLNVAVTDRTKIAAAAPIRTGLGTANTGSGQITAGKVNSPPPPDVNLQQPVTITFTSPTTFDVVGVGTGDPSGLTYTPGQDITFNGWTIQISGSPNANDTFSIGPNTNGVGDNRNALLLAGLQTDKTLDGGKTSFQGVYGQLVAQVGNKAHELEVTSKAEANLLEQAEAARQEQSGVNLDEEATNLIKFQQAYAAAGKVMMTAQKMFETLIALGS